MSRKKAESWLETRQDELKTLIEQQTTAADELAGLEAKWTQANKMRECGDLHQQKLMDDLKLKIEPLKDKLVALAGLIADTVKATEDAQAVLDGIRAREHADALAAAQERMAQDVEQLRADMPALELEIVESYISLGLLLGQYVIAQERVGGPCESLDAKNYAFRLRLQSMVPPGLVLIDHPGPMVTMPPAPMIRVNGGAQAQGPVNLKQFVAQQKETALAGYLKELTHE